MGQALAVLRSASQYGSAAAVLVSGPAGIGKTALLSEIRSRATAMAFRIGSGKCDQIEQVWPGAPVIAMLRSGPAALVSAADYEKITRLVSEPLLLADQIASSLENAALAGPLLIAIDDFHWSDRVTRFTVRTLIPRLIGLPVVWVLASQADDFGLDLNQIRAEAVRLAPLPATDIMAIVQDQLGRPPDERTRRFAETADGNPLLAIQIIDHLAGSAERGEPGEVPGEFTAAIAQRAAELTGAARQVLNVAAVAGRPWPAREIAALMPGTDDPERERAVADVVGAGLITISGGMISFRHDLVREAICAGIPDALASHLHQAFATYYLTVANDPLMAASHARHAATAGDACTAEILLRAAEKLAGVSAADAGELAALAFRTVQPAQSEWLSLSLRCLSVLCRAQHAAEAITVADMILARTDDAGTIGTVETEAARALWLGGRITELLARTEIALKIAGLDAAVIARLRAVRALANTRLVDGGTAAEEAGAALESARASGDLEARELALQAAGEAAANEADHRAALSHFRELRSMRDIPCLAEEITALQFLDRQRDAQVLLDQARADSRATTETMLPALAYAQAWQDFTLGRLDDADSGACALIELGNQLGSSLYTIDAVIVRVSVALLRGDSETAATQLRYAEALSGADDMVRKPGLAVMRGWIAATRGDVQEAVVTLRDVVDGASRRRAFWPVWPCWNGLFFEFASMAADRHFTSACVSIAETAAVRNTGVASFEGLAMNLRGRISNDLEVIARSAEFLTQSPRPTLRAYGADTYGRALLAAGERQAGLAQLDLAWDEYHQIGAVAFRAETQRAMREAGARRAKWSATARRPSTGWPSLTHAERRVATLIGAGHANKSAATELGVSVNTVSTHLRAVFTKLGIQSRVQLAHELHDQEVSHAPAPTRSAARYHRR
jgi:DNA-binding CsgD family transcriptional regulator